MALHSAGAGGGTVTATYTGAYTSGEVEIGGEKLMLLSLTGSGNLSFNVQTIVDVWLCNGGQNGVQNATASAKQYGGNGGNFDLYTGVSIKDAIVTIGAANGSTTFGTLTATTKGSGGGGSGDARNVDTGLAGGGVSTVPFNDTENFDPHCAGGGGGGWNNGTYRAEGGTGGSNGAKGSTSVNTNLTSAAGGSGGSRGGGTGGRKPHLQNPTVGTAATFYGSGGGGSGFGRDTSTGTTVWLAPGGGAGYQGVVYVLYKTKKPKPFTFTYSGDYTDTIIDVNGTPKRLLTFLSSGVLTVKNPGMADLFMCGGGANGGSASGTSSTTKRGGAGGGGGRVVHATAVALTEGEHAITIGAAGSAGGATTFLTYTANGALSSSGYKKNKIDGSGGGTGAEVGSSSSDYDNGSNGEGISTLPFADSVNFKYHSPGGGGGAQFKENQSGYTTQTSGGGAGGSNGSNGGADLGSYGSSGGAGGNYGGGKGGNVTSQNAAATEAGSPGTYYGAGGGGGGGYEIWTVSGSTYTLRAGGAGYQGVMYLLLDAA